MMGTALCVAVTLGCEPNSESSVASNSESTPDGIEIIDAEEENGADIPSEGLDLEGEIDGLPVEENSWQENPEYPFPSDDVMAIWSLPYTYPEKECVVLPEETNVPDHAITIDEDGNKTLCFWENAQGCMPAGVGYTEYTSCDIAMTTSARFFKFPGYKFESDITLLDQPEYEQEADWARDQIRSCGCLCCHDAEQGAEQGFATAFDIGADGIWTDTMTDFGLLTAAGVIDTELLGGTFDPTTNHGFNRVKSIFPSDDEDRMTAFFLKEVERRGLSSEEIQALIDSVPNRFSGLYVNYTEETEPCGPGYGIDDAGIIHWGGSGKARYVYIMEAEARNVGDPPGLDSPEGILWRMDTRSEAEPFESGTVMYGIPPEEGAFTRVPETGEAPDLIEGTTYKMFILKDFGPLRLANCSFIYGEPVEVE